MRASEERQAQSVYTTDDVLHIHAALTGSAPWLRFNKANGNLALIRFVTVGLLVPQRWTGLIVMGLEQHCLACGRAVNLFHTTTAPKSEWGNCLALNVTCGQSWSLSFSSSVQHDSVRHTLKARIARDSKILQRCRQLCWLKVVLNKINSCIDAQ